jgi:hypothetical protein
VPALIKMLQVENDDFARLRAAETLGMIGPDAKSAVPILIQLLEAADDWQKTGYVTALQTITGQEFGEDIQQWKIWLEANKDR